MANELFAFEWKELVMNLMNGQKSTVKVAYNCQKLAF